MNGHNAETVQTVVAQWHHGMLTLLCTCRDSGEVCILYFEVLPYTSDMYMRG